MRSTLEMFCELLKDSAKPWLLNQCWGVVSLGASGHGPWW